MSVPKGKRKESKIEFYNNAYRLHENIVKYLINDFGLKKSSYDYQLFVNRSKMSPNDNEVFSEIVDKYGIEIESDYCRYIVFHYRDEIIALLDSMMTNITRGYSIYPNTEEDWNMKRRYQNQAITDLYAVKTKLTLALKELNANFNKYVPFIAMIDDEITALKQWRGDCNKERIKCMENDIVKRTKAEKGAADKLISEREAQKKANIAERVINLSQEINGNNYQIPKYLLNAAYNNYMYGNYQFTFDPYSNMITGCNNPIPCLLTLDQYGNCIGPVY